jgi:pyrimidine operon attenuation protein/uracil phosphoribosyltransferase
MGAVVGDAAIGGESGESRELMSAADVGRTVSRIAHQIIEKTALDSPDAPRVVLLGIPTRGVILAERLATNIREYSGVDVARGALDITLYRDDLMSKPPRPLGTTSIPAGGIDDALVILVGKNVPTSRTESVHVQLSEHDDRDGVVISRDGA